VAFAVAFYVLLILKVTLFKFNVTIKRQSNKANKKNNVKYWNILKHIRIQLNAKQLIRFPNPKRYPILRLIIFVTY
jgi:hypothetical protein